MMKRTAKSMAVCVMAFLLLCGCSPKSKESVNTQQDIASEYFGTGTSSDVDDPSKDDGTTGGDGNTTAEAGSATVGGAAGSIAGGASTGSTGSTAGEADEAAENIFVYVCGAVKEPGVYVLPEGSRVYEAIRMAGGMTPEANEAFVNQARELVDGEQITVYTKEETQGLDPEKYAYDSPAGDMTGTKGKVNINTATVEELMTLSGIGEARAEAIIEYRETNGAFRDTSDIMKISGIGEALYNKIKDDIVVS